jgi:hypothetical protein
MHYLLNLEEFKIYLSIADMLPHYHITYKDVILPSVLIYL